MRLDSGWKLRLARQRYHLCGRLLTRLDLPRLNQHRNAAWRNEDALHLHFFPLFHFHHRHYDRLRRFWSQHPGWILLHDFCLVRGSVLLFGHLRSVWNVNHRADSAQNHRVEVPWNHQLSAGNWLKPDRHDATSYCVRQHHRLHQQELPLRRGDYFELGQRLLQLDAPLTQAKPGFHPSQNLLQKVFLLL